MRQTTGLYGPYEEENMYIWSDENDDPGMDEIDEAMAHYVETGTDPRGLLSEAEKHLVDDLVRAQRR